MRFWPLAPSVKLTAVALVAAVTLAACGGGDDQDNNPPTITAVKVFGDSLSDSGTFEGWPGYGRTFTVQGTRNEPTVLWTEHVAAAYGLAALCPVYKFNGASFVANPKPGCTSFAVGGGRINASKVADPGMPSSIIRQLQDGAAAGWSKTDLLLIDGGGNDAADLVTLFMNVNDDKVYNDYLRLLASKVPAAELEEALAGENGLVDAATLYMQRLADGFVADVRALTLDKGAQQVVVANMPAIVYTPRFQAVLDQVGMATGPETRARLEALVNGWVGAFNQRLAEGFAGERRVRVVDLASRFTDQVRNPAKYGLSNVSLPVCGDEWPRPVPRRSFDECTAAALSDTPPPEGGPTGTSWWERYMFADSFHPTPYGHALLGDLVLDALDDANWL